MAVKLALLPYTVEVRLALSPLSSGIKFGPVFTQIGGVTLAPQPEHEVARLVHWTVDTVKKWRSHPTLIVGSEAGLSDLPEDLGALASISVFFTGEVDKVYVWAANKSIHY